MTFPFFLRYSIQYKMIINHRVTEAQRKELRFVKKTLCLSDSVVRIGF